MGYRVIGLNHKKKPHAHADETYGLGEVDAFLGASDVVVILRPRTEETANLMDRRRLDAMKKGAMLVNLGRGGIVDETALAEKLKDGSLGGAAFDVFGEEPLPAASPLWGTPNLLITPHMAGGFPKYIPHVLQLFAKNIARVRAGEPPLTPVDLRRGY